MTLLALIAALALEQLRPLGSRNRVWLLFIRYANHLERNFNAGSIRHGVYAWLTGIIPVSVMVLGIQLLLDSLTPLLGLCWSILVLYLTMGFRHFSGAFSAMSRALYEGKEFEAREALRDWTGQPTSELSVPEMVRLAIEQGVLDSYRHVFGTMFWFAVFGAIGAGPLGAVLYQLSSMLGQKWGTRGIQSDPFGRCAAWALHILDWLPVRLTAVSFAIMGNFEDAVFCWRSQASTWGGYASGVLLATAAGAIGVRLGDPLRQDYTINYRPELGIGEEAEPAYLKSAVGLIWRCVLLWLFVILLLTVVHLAS